MASEASPKHETFAERIEEIEEIENSNEIELSGMKINELEEKMSEIKQLPGKKES